MTTYFTSDWHIGHKNILHLANRPFSTIEECDETIITNYQSVVKDDDHVYMLGDICWSWQNVPHVLKHLPGHKHLIIGNHEAGLFKEVWKLSNTNKFYKFYLDAGFETIDSSLVIDIGGQAVNLNHFPYRVDNPEPEYDDRYHDMRPVDNGNFLIHGHQHNKMSFYNGARQFNVSVEVTNYKPVSLKTISYIMSAHLNTIHKSVLSVEGADYIPFS